MILAALKGHDPAVKESFEAPRRNEKRTLNVYKILLDLVLVLVVIVAIWQVAKLALRALVYLIKLSAVTIALTPRAYAAAKAEAALAARDLAFDFDGKTGDAGLFNAIVKDRLARTRVAAQHSRLAWKATNFGRKLANPACPPTGRDPLSPP